MTALLQFGDLRIEIVRKSIRNVHLSVYPPDGRVRLAAPKQATDDAIRLFAIAKLGWIRRQQKKLRRQEREPSREYLERESHYVWGRRYLLAVVEREMRPAVELRHKRMILRIRPGTSADRREAIVAEWYRGLVKHSVIPLVAKWAPLIGVAVNRCFVQHMKTHWGSCNPASRNIRVNTELAKKPPECLEYIIVHELIHLLEPTHNERFSRLMSQFMPKWQLYRDELNRLPLRHECWVRTGS